MFSPHLSPSYAEYVDESFSVIFALVSVDEHVDGGVDGEEEVTDGEHEKDALHVIALLDTF